MLTIRDAVVDPALSQVSIAYKNDEYIAEMLFPVVRVGKSIGKYYIFDKSNLRRNKTDRAIGSKANEVEYSLSTDSYSTKDHALKEAVPFEIMEQADAALSPEVDSTESVTEMLLIDKEVALATSMQSTGTITQNVTLSGTDQWSDFDNSDPFDDIRTAITTVQKAIGRRPNTLVLGQQVFDKLADHPDLVDRVKYTSKDSLTAEMIAKIFNLKQCIIGSAVYNTANEGQTDSLDFIWGKNAWVCYVPEAVKLKQVAFGFTITNGSREVEKWDETDAKARYIRVHDEYVQKFVAAEACYLIKNAVA